MHSMNDLDITFDAFELSVTNQTMYDFGSELLELYEDGYTVDDVVEYGEWKLECDDVFSSF